MELHELSFGKFIILQKDVAEIIINEGIEMDSQMVDQYHNFLLENLTVPFAVIINKINNYTYSFEAQKKLGSLKELKAIAVVVYDRVSEISTEAVASFPRDVQWNLKVFNNRDEAFSWVTSENH